MGSRVVSFALALTTLACGEEAPPAPEPTVTEPEEAPSRPGYRSEVVDPEGLDEALADPELDPFPPPEPPTDDFEAPPEGEAGPPDRAAFTELWGRWLRLDEVAPVAERDDVVEYRTTVVARRGTVRVGLHTTWPRLFPEERVIDLCARRRPRRLDARPHRAQACEGDRVFFWVPVSSPPPEWAEPPAGRAEPEEDTSRPLAVIPEAQLPAAVRALSPEIGDARTRARADEMRVTYWMRAQRPGAVALALPLHFPSPALRVLSRGDPLTEYVDFAPGAGYSPPPRELRIGDAIAIGFLRP